MENDPKVELQEFHSFTIHAFRQEWHVPKAYTDVSDLSAGQYGTVAKGYVKNPKTRKVLGISEFVGYDEDGNEIPRNHETPHVVIKKLQTPFYDKTLAKRCMREISILKHLQEVRDHLNVLSIYHVFSPNDWRSDLGNLKDIYITTSFDGQPLENLINQMRNGHLNMEIDHIAFVAYQLHRVLEF